MHIGVLAERGRGERRVALTPTVVAALVEAGHRVSVEGGAGAGCAIDDARYVEAGSRICDLESLGDCDLIVSVRGLGTFDGSPRPADVLGPATTTIALFEPLWRTANVEAVAATGATMLSLELVPRITRAQSMDVLSSMASVAGYEAVLLAARRFGRMFPLMMTAAGTLPAARVLVLGAGVAGLAAIATARRLGAIVSGYDVRPAAAEQIESLGAKAIDLTPDLSTEAQAEGEAETEGGYATAQTEGQNQRQRSALAPHVAEADVVITTAAIPGRASPLLVTSAMVAAMRPGSVIVDLAAERGGNCELTVADTEIDHGGVAILGPTDLAQASPLDASAMFATNLMNLIDHLDAGASGDVDTNGHDDAGPGLSFDSDDEITAAMLVTTQGAIVHPGVADAVARGRSDAADETARA